MTFEEKIRQEANKKYPKRDDYVSPERFGFYNGAKHAQRIMREEIEIVLYECAGALYNHDWGKFLEQKHEDVEINFHISEVKDNLDAIKAIEDFRAKYKIIPHKSVESFAERVGDEERRNEGNI